MFDNIFKILLLCILTGFLSLAILEKDRGRYEYVENDNHIFEGYIFDNQTGKTYSYYGIHDFKVWGIDADKESEKKAKKYTDSISNSIMKSN
jgi:hypothetical protein